MHSHDVVVENESLIGFLFVLEQDYSTLAPLTFGPGYFFFVGSCPLRLGIFSFSH